MVSNASSADSSAMLQAMALMQQQMGAANTDGISGLSKSELSSINAGDDVGGAAFLKSLTDQFDQLDANADGQLSSDEIAKAKPSEKLGPPPGLEISSSEDSGSSNSIEELLKKLLKQLEENFTKSEKTASGSLDNADSDSPFANALKAADYDGVAGLSLEELSSMDSSEDTKQSDFVKKLTEKFDKLDANDDGQLSQTEIAALKPGNSTNSGGNSSDNSSFGTLAGSFFQKLMDSYKNGDLAKLASSLNISV